MIIADIQTPVQLTPAVTTVAPKKPQTPGEEQIRIKTQGEVLHKQYTTSEYSNLVNSCSWTSYSKAKTFLYLLSWVRAHRHPSLFSASDAADSCVCDNSIPMYARLHSCLLRHTHTVLSSAEATHWAASLERLFSPNHSEHDHATEQLHAHLWQMAGA